MVFNVMPNRLHAPTVNRKDSVPALPGEVGEVRLAVLDPKTRHPLKLFHVIRLRGGLTEATENVDVIAHAADGPRLATQLIGYSSEKAMNLKAKCPLTEEWASVFR